MPRLELRALRVKECGPLRDVEIDFTGPSGTARSVTVLGGANGSGKTTALELIAALAEPVRGNSVVDRVRYAEIELLIGDEKIGLAAGRREDFPAPSPRHYGVATDQRPGSRNIGDNGPYVRLIHNPNMGQSNLDLNLISRKEAESQDLLPSILYFPHFRSLAPVQGQNLNKEPTLYEWVHRYEVVREFTGSLESYLVWLDYAEPQIFQATIDFLNHLPFDGKTFFVERRALKAMVRTRDGHVHPLDQLSSGEQNVLILLMELRRRLLPHSIVLIDEIENSLHPAFQHRLAEGLLGMQKEIPFQLILTTHSRTLVDLFGAESTLLLTDF